METSRRSAGVGLLVYGVGTAAAFMTIGAPGGDYEDKVVATYISTDHRVTAFVLAYVGAFAALGLLPFAARMRSEMRAGGDLFWGLAVAATAAGVIGWFLLGGIAVVAAEGGSTLTSLPHTVVYALSELAILVTSCATAFLLGVAALLLAARAPLPTGLRVLTVTGGVCGLLAAGFFTLFGFWLWTVGFGGWVLARRAGRAVEQVPAPQPA